MNTINGRFFGGLSGAGASPPPSRLFSAWALALIALLAAASLCRGDETTEQVRVSAAAVLDGIQSQPDLPNAPPSVSIRLRKSGESQGAATGVCPEDAATTVSVVYIDAKAGFIINRGGSGVYVNYNGVPVLLTAAHVVMDIPDGGIVMAGEDRAKIVLIDKLADIAALYTGKHAAIELADADPNPGDSVDSWGRGEGGEMSNVQDVAVSLHSGGGYHDMPFIFLKQYPPQGRSGGGVFRNGRLFGLLHAREENSKQGMCSRIEALKKFLDRINLTGKRRATVYTGQDVHGENWCINCESFRRRIGVGNEGVEVTYSRAVVPSGPETYPAVRFSDVNGEERFPSRDGKNYHVVSSADELIGFIDRNDAAFIIKEDE